MHERPVDLTTSDEELAEAASAGDQDAFATLVRRWRGPIHDYLARVTRNRDDAADLTQETFLKAWRKMPQRRLDARFRPWLYAIAHNAALDALRSRRPTEVLEDEWSMALASPGTTGDPESVVLARETASDVWKAASALSPTEYVVIHCRLRLDMDAADIATATGMRPGAVHTALSRARDSLEEAFTILQLARHGRRQCPVLDGIFGGQEPGELTRAARRSARAHLKECDRCRVSSARLVSAAQAFAGLAPVLPPEHLPSLPGSDRQARRRRRGRRAGVAAAAAGVAALVGVASARTDRVGAPPDRTPPADPLELRSPGAPTPGGPALVTWPAAHDPMARGQRSSGVAGYSVAWSNEPRTLPDRTVDAGPGPGTSSALASRDRPTWFHLRTADRAGNWTSTVHFRLPIDLGPTPWFLRPAPGPTAVPQTTPAPGATEPAPAVTTLAPTTTPPPTTTVTTPPSTLTTPTTATSTTPTITGTSPSTTTTTTASSTTTPRTPTTTTTTPPPTATTTQPPATSTTTTTTTTTTQPPTTTTTQPPTTTTTQPPTTTTTQPPATTTSTHPPPPNR